MFGANDVKSIVLAYDFDPAADDDLFVLKAPQTMKIVSASFTTNNTIAASTANYFDLALYNGGTAGTAVTVIAGTIANGTAGYTALTPRDFTITNGTVTAGQIVYLRYDETGTGTFVAGALQVNYTTGN